MRDGDCRLPSLSRAEATSLIKSLNNSRCVDIFGINTYDLKCIADDLAPFIVQIFNEILVKEDFPSILPKNNRVFGLLKAKGSREDATKYRPIFVSLWLSKILQKGFLSRFQKLGLTIHPAQQAYQNSKSTSTALLNLRNTLQSHQFMTFVDYKGCFEAVSHQPLLQAISEKSIRCQVPEVELGNEGPIFTEELWIFFYTGSSTFR